jgi:hypothetical protein
VKLKPLYEVYLIRKKEQVGEKRSTLCTHRYAGCCLLKNTIKDTTDTDRYASYLDLHLEIDRGGRLRTKLYGKRDDFNFPIVNFPRYEAYLSVSVVSFILSSMG